MTDRERYDKSLHKLYRAMHDGICPACGLTDDKTKVLTCPACGFSFTDAEIDRVQWSIRHDMTAALAIINAVRAGYKIGD